MQNQQEFYKQSNTPEETPTPFNERQTNTDPREQPQVQSIRTAPMKRAIAIRASEMDGRARARNCAQSQNSGKIWVSCWRW
jgi:hypothetical protein